MFEDESHSGTDLVHFGGFPGVYVPGEKVSVSELEFATVKDATDRADELGVPLKRTTVAVGKGPLAARENHALSETEARAAGVTEPEQGQPGAKLAEGEVFPPAPEPLPEVTAGVTPLEPGAEAATDATGEAEAAGTHGDQT